MIMNITSGDALIHCEISGRDDAPVLLFLHGNGENLLIFDPQIRHFSQHFRTIAIDTRAHGLSTRGTASLNFYTFANDLLAVLDKLQIDKAHIIGFSDGAITALHTALVAQERISSMILLGVNSHTKGLRLMPRLLIRLTYILLMAGSLFSKKLRQRKETWSLMVYHPNLSMTELSRINVPTLIVTGEKDMVSKRHNDEISRAIAGSQRHIVPRGDHFWMFKKPEVLNRLAAEFFSLLPK